MRVHELAKKLEKPSRALILDLQGMGVTVASHSSALAEETVQKVLGTPTKSGRRLVLIKRKESEAVQPGQTVGDGLHEGERPAPVLKSLPTAPEFSAQSEIQSETSRSAA